MCSLNSRNPSSLLWMALELVRFSYRRSGAVLGRKIKIKNGLNSKALAQQLQLSVIQSLPPPPPLSSRLLPGSAYSQRTTICWRNNVKSSDLVLDLKGRLLSTLKGASKSHRSTLNSVIILFYISFFSPFQYQLQTNTYKSEQRLLLKPVPICEIEFKKVNLSRILGSESAKRLLIDCWTPTAEEVILDPAKWWLNYVWYIWPCKAWVN